MLDKVAVNASEPLFYNVVNTVGAVIVLFVIAKITVLIGAWFLKEKFTRAKAAAFGFIAAGFIAGFGLASANHL